MTPIPKRNTNPKPRGKPFVKGDKRIHRGVKSTSFGQKNSNYQSSALSNKAMCDIRDVVQRHSSTLLEEALSKGTIHNLELSSEQILEVMKWSTSFIHGSSIKERSESAALDRGESAKDPSQMSRLELAQHVQALPSQGSVIIESNEIVKPPPTLSSD